MRFSTLWQSPLGWIMLECSDRGLNGLSFEEQAEYEEYSGSHAMLDEGIKWLESYFQGNNPPLNALPLDLSGTPFQMSVWKFMQDIPYGSTITYGDIARELQSSPRAVGNAVGRNPLCIIIPCHRVIGAHGKLTGYAYGLERKTWLLRHEGVICPRLQQTHAEREL